LNGFQVGVLTWGGGVMQAKGGEALKHPPHPLQTVELQKRASRYLRMGAELSIKMAEELYMVRGRSV
jgi:DNA topoisomerase-3